jgi:UDP-3-O-[3-hydroxymyristoyl] glucosamine N-acyltransferase
VPQVGAVELGDDVEVGALTAIDRATAGSTEIHTGVKLDNLIQIGHNSIVGEHTVIAGQTAVGGSSTLGRRNDIGGHVAVTDHVTTTDDVIIAGMSGVAKDMPDPGAFWGLPAQPFIEAKRISALHTRLPEIYRQIKQMEKRIAELERERS